MSLYKHRLLGLLLLSSLAMLLTQCAPASIKRLDPGGPYYYNAAQWSPNSRQIVYTRFEVEAGVGFFGRHVLEKYQTGEIVVMDVDTREVQRLTHNEFLEFTPTWSPDGKRIAYGREESMRTGQLGNDVITDTIRIINSDGTDDREVFVCPYGCAYLSWSPVGDQIAFNMLSGTYVPAETDPGEAPVEIFLIDQDGSNLTQLTDGNREAGEPRWSPDGRQIVFLRHVRENPVRILELQTGVETSFGVGDLRGVSSPGWSPDGSGIIFSASPPERGPGQLYVLRLADSTISPLFDEPSSLPVHNMDEPDWSPDGNKIVFSEYRQELYIADLTILKP